MLENVLDTTLDSFLPWKSIVDKYFKETTPEPPSEAPIVATNMVEEPRVTFEEEDSDQESDGGGPPIHLSDETVELNVESLDEKEEEVGELVPSEELVLKL